MSGIPVRLTLKKVLIASVFGLAMFLIPNGVQSAVNNSATLEWSANQESDLGGYRVYHGTSPGIYSDSQDAGKTVTFRFADLAPNETHFFTVTAYDTSKNESLPSPEVHTTIIAPDSVLSVSVTGDGTVRSNPGDLSCSSGTCSGTFTQGSSVTLTATPGIGKIFDGWNGSCTGTGACVVPISTSSASVLATFDVSLEEQQRLAAAAEKLKKEQLAAAAAEKLKKEQLAAAAAEKLKKEQLAAAAAEKLKKEQLAAAAAEKLKKEQLAAAEKLKEGQLAAAAEIEKLQEPQQLTKAQAQGKKRKQLAQVKKQQQLAKVKAQAKKQRQLAQVKKQQQLAKVKAQVKKQQQLVKVKAQDKKRKQLAQVKKQQQLAKVKAQAKKKQQLAQVKKQQQLAKAKAQAKKQQQLAQIKKQQQLAKVKAQVKKQQQLAKAKELTARIQNALAKIETSLAKTDRPEVVARLTKQKEQYFMVLAKIQARYSMN